MTWPFFLLSFLGHLPACAAHFVHFYAIRAVTEMMQGRMKKKENSQLVLNSITGLPLSSILFIFLLLISVFTIPPLVISKCRISVGHQETQIWNTVSFSNSACSPLNFCLWYSVCLDRRMNEGYRGEWTLGFPAPGPPHLSWLKETGWLKGCGGVNGGILVGLAEV